MGISIGKLSLYTACAGIRPSTTLPIVLDVGTENDERLNDPLYIGWRHRRVRGAEYDDFVDAFVSAVRRRWPHVLLQWEDFAKPNATRLLARYRDQLCTFNDDVQGTAAVATGTLMAALKVTSVPLREQRIVIVGAGSAGCGIANLLRAAMIDDGMQEQACRPRILLVDQRGLLVDGMEGIEDFQKSFLQERSVVASWRAQGNDAIELLDVIQDGAPTALIGVSGQAGLFNEKIIRAMARVNKRPVIFSLSNPLSRSEATPHDIERWSDGRAIIGTGTQFPPLVREGKTFTVDQTNNSYIFPGVALGTIAVKARRVNDRMFMAAARALAEMSPASNDPSANLLMPVSQLRDVATRVAFQVALQARDDGLTETRLSDTDIQSLIDEKVWHPLYQNLSSATDHDSNTTPSSTHP
jgi:malate dehydrogenase (oxaloacetate-decarboxylating)